MFYFQTLSIWKPLTPTTPPFGEPDETLSSGHVLILWSLATSTLIGIPLFQLMRDCLHACCGILSDKRIGPSRITMVQQNSTMRRSTSIKMRSEKLRGIACSGDINTLNSHGVGSMYLGIRSRYLNVYFGGPWAQRMNVREMSDRPSEHIEKHWTWRKITHGCKRL